jgi:hypothetical protein
MPKCVRISEYCSSCVDDLLPAHKQEIVRMDRNEESPALFSDLTTKEQLRICMKFNSPLPQVLPKECTKAAKICWSRFLRFPLSLASHPGGHSHSPLSMREEMV